MPNIQTIDRLKSQLLTSGIQEKNQALFQVINQLIDFTRQTVLELEANEPTWNPPHMSDAAAPSDSVFYSTTSNKLSYKDDAGTVTVLN